MELEYNSVVAKALRYFNGLMNDEGYDFADAEYKTMAKFPDVQWCEVLKAYDEQA